MKRNSTIALFFVVFFLYSCAKVDKEPPIISFLEVNGKTDEVIYIGIPKLSIEYEVFDNEFVVDSKIKIVENANLDSGYFYIHIQSINANAYTGSLNVTLPDSIFQLKHQLTVSIDAFDDSGNQATQLNTIIKFR